MSDPTQSDLAKAAAALERAQDACVVEPGSLRVHTMRAIAQAIADARADEREATRESCLREVLRETDNWDGETERPLRVVAERIRRLP